MLCEPATCLTCRTFVLHKASIAATLWEICADNQYSSFNFELEFRFLFVALQSRPSALRFEPTAADTAMQSSDCFAPLTWMLLTPGIATVTICPSDPEKPIRGQHNQHKHRTRHCVTAADRRVWYRRRRGCIGPDVVLFLCHTAVNEVNLLRISIHCEEYDGVQYVSQHKQ